MSGSTTLRNWTPLLVPFIRNSFFRSKSLQLPPSPIRKQFSVHRFTGCSSPLVVLFGSAGAYLGVLGFWGSGVRNLRTSEPQNIRTLLHHFPMQRDAQLELVLIGLDFKAVDDDQPVPGRRIRQRHMLRIADRC